MARRDPRIHIDSDGVRSVESPRSRLGVWLAAAALIALALVFLALRPRAEPTPVEIAAGESQAAAEPGVAPRRAQPPRFKPVRRPEPPAEAPPADVPSPPETAPNDTAEQADEAIGDDDEANDDGPTGIALFPPPGTDPAKSGLIVPEDFPLPPGYVRHYQSTDDGRRLPAILMFHPDYEWVDESGEPIEVPEDGVVPPELAPEGLPLETLEVPETVIPIIEEPGPGETATD